jgi:hypothetical protein
MYILYILYYMYIKDLKYIVCMSIVQRGFNDAELLFMLLISTLSFRTNCSIERQSREMDVSSFNEI